MTTEDPEMAMLNITVNQQNGDLIQPVFFAASDADIKTWAAEAVRNGSVRGVDPDQEVNFRDFVVDRFPAHDGLPARLALRPKTEFGTRPIA